MSAHHLSTCTSNTSPSQCDCGAPTEKPSARMVGEDGNAYAVMGRVARSLRKAGASEAYVKAYYDESTNSESYDKLLVVAWRFAELN